MVKLAACVAAMVAVGLGTVVSGQVDSAPDEVVVEAVLDELEAAGAPATVAEVAAMVGPPAQMRFRSYITGALVARTGVGPRRTGRARWRGVHWEMRGKWRQPAYQRREFIGTVTLRERGWRFTAGQMGLSQGFGLLVGKPGRSRTLAADGGLGTGRQAISPWLGQGAQRAIRGGGIERSGEVWQVLTFVGLRAAGAAGDGAKRRPFTLVSRVGVQGERWRIAALALVTPLEQGGSLTGRFRRRGLSGSWEGVCRRAGAGKIVTAGLIQARWRWRRSAAVEWLGGWADPGPRPVMGARHPVFGSWAGRGLAARCYFRTASGVRLDVLWHRGRGRKTSVFHERRIKTLTDILAVWEIAAEWRGELRWRTGGERVSVWSERFPWQPARPKLVDIRNVASAKAVWKNGSSRVQVNWRRLARDRFARDTGAVQSGVRSLLTLGGRCALGPRMDIRGSWTMSWGDAEDLVSALVPYRGYVVPRHWGNFRAERMLGLAWRRGPLVVKVAGSWRQAEPARASDRVAAWAEASWSW